MSTPHVIASSSGHPSHAVSSNNGIVGGHYKVGKKIGEGSFGVVFEGVCLCFVPSFCAFDSPRAVPVLFGLLAYRGSVCACSDNIHLFRSPCMNTHKLRRCEGDHQPTCGHKICMLIPLRHGMPAEPVVVGTPEVRCSSVTR